MAMTSSMAGQFLARPAVGEHAGAHVPRARAATSSCGPPILHQPARQERLLMCAPPRSQARAARRAERGGRPPAAASVRRLRFDHTCRAQASGVQSTSVAAGDEYVVSDADREFFRVNGYVHLKGVLSEAELAAEIEPVYNKFLTGELKPEGKDLCDMSGATDRTPDQFTVFNAMLPRVYHPEWQGNLFERRCQSIADQLQGGDMAIDYDQILAKRPSSEDAVFAWHQDMAYWPPFTQETATATCWLAVDDSTVANGCMRFIPGSHNEPELRPHRPVKLKNNRLDEDGSHALYTVVDEAAENVQYVEISRGDITVHNESVVHGSGPNLSEGWRRAYVLAFRKASTVAEERKWGFSHSHNDTFNWDQFHDWTKNNANSPPQ